MIAARLLVRREDSTWYLSDPAVAVAANEGAVRSKLLTAPWESLLELGRDELPRQVPDLRPYVPTPPAKIVVRIRTSGLDWPQYEYYGLVQVETPPEDLEQQETPPDPETTEA